MGNNSKHQVIKSLYLITQISVTMLTAIFMCIGIGYLVDKWFETKLMVWFIILGVVSGFRAVYILIRRHLTNDRES